jgi:NTP pyrophosphatase (non-canonical NTP hydrolase)
MNGDITVPELDELIDGVKIRIDAIKEYGPPEGTETTLEDAEYALRKIAEYIARCNIHGYTDMVFHAGKLFGDIGETAKVIKKGAITGFFNEKLRPCKKCSSKEITEEYADLLAEIALAITTIVVVSSEFLKDNCCPISEEELLKHI